ncbi:MAG: mechanosensitive ion channel family protein [Chloroflexaceae bacterium]|nr:mechanosensitive ion channel family protein [Chloroflexaceae bacterium]
MVEETEAVQINNLLLLFISNVLPIVVGVLIEATLYWIKHLGQRKGWRLRLAIAQALQWQVIGWVLIGVLFRSLTDIVRDPALIMPAATLLNALFILLITIGVIRLLTGLVTLYLQQTAVASTSILQNMIRVGGLFVGLGVFLQNIGFQIGPWLTVIAGSSVGITLALQGPLSNLFAGITLLASNRIRPGHYVKLASGEEGYVVDIQWHTTTIRQLANNLVVVPNGVMVSAIVINYDEPEPELSILIEVGVSYDSDLRHVERVTLEVADEVMQNVSGGVQTANCLFRYHTFADFSINFTVILRGQQFIDQYLLKHEFVKRLHERYHAEGIVIPFPIRTLATDSTQPLHLQGIWSDTERVSLERNAQMKTLPKDTPLTS